MFPMFNHYQHFIISIFNECNIFRNIGSVLGPNNINITNIDLPLPLFNVQSIYYSRDVGFYSRFRFVCLQRSRIYFYSKVRSLQPLWERKKKERRAINAINHLYSKVITITYGIISYWYSKPHSILYCIKSLLIIQFYKLNCIM